MATSILIEVLRDPNRLKGAGPRDWERLISEAFSSQLAARLAERIEEAGLKELIPERANYQFAAARILKTQQHADVFREVEALRKALCSRGLPFVLLKGGAYVVGGFSANMGRTLSDLDILVRKADLDRVEKQLFLSDWTYLKREAYDQIYYRKWMHELPPLRHLERRSVLDVHHTVTPPTSAMAVEGARIFEKATFGGKTGDDRIGIPMPADLVLHSSVHLFNDSEFESALRDLSDLDLLLREFGAQEDFWLRLVERAKELGLTSSLYFAVTLARDSFATPVPAEAMENINATAPGWWSRAILSRLFAAVLLPLAPSGESRSQQLAAFALYVRGHALRMPLRLLIPHLLRQAFRRSRFGQGDLAQA